MTKRLNDVSTEEWSMAHKKSMESSPELPKGFSTAEMALAAASALNTQVGGEDSMSDIEKTLIERGGRYGEYKEHARITQNIKKALIDSPQWRFLSDDKKECLEMVAHKIGRILNGDPEYADSWHDIIGYIRLVEKEL